MSTPVPPNSFGARARIMPLVWGILGLLFVAGAGASAIYFTHFRGAQAGGVPALDVSLRQASLPTAPDSEPLPEFGLPNAPYEKAGVLDLEKEVARAMNTAVPLSGETIVPARAFASRLEGVDRDRARTCLALAAIFEAGSSVNDQKPVMQVILNRVRHPAFPNSVCEVVFQGAERKTGCQFSFTCDGSMRRTRPPQTVLSRAKGLAEWMLASGVDQRVGHATHYHTEWVVPHWSPKLTKIAKVNTHIFLGWPGYWGKRSAFKVAPSGEEGAVALLAAYEVAHSASDAEISLTEEEWAALNALDPDGVGSGQSNAQSFVEEPASAFYIPTKTLGFDQGMTPGRWALNAAGLCGDLPDCRVVGWANPALTPGQLNNASLAKAPPDLVFVQDLRNRIQTAYWDCAKWGQAGTSKCLGSSSDRVALVNGTRSY